MDDRVKNSKLQGSAKSSLKMLRNVAIRSLGGVYLGDTWATYPDSRHSVC